MTVQSIALFVVVVMQKRRLNNKGARIVVQSVAFGGNVFISGFKNAGINTRCFHHTVTAMLLMGHAAGSSKGGAKRAAENGTAERGEVNTFFYSEIEFEFYKYNIRYHCFSFCQI